MTHSKSFEAIKQCYSTWGETYFDQYYGEQASYPQVQIEIIRDLLRREKAQHVLDAGCGPASMLRLLTDVDAELYGFDLTPEMIASARTVFVNLNLDPDRLWEGNVVDPAAYRWPKKPDQEFDAVLCAGVLPHIPENLETTVIRNLYKTVRPGGVVCVEARNEFFALFTMNRYSRDFVFQSLIEADSLRANAGAERQALDEALGEFERMYRLDIPPIRQGTQGEPGYDEVLSRLHNPLELPLRFQEIGFTDVTVLFYHFHALPPMLGRAVPQLFRSRSVAMETNPRDWRGHFMASAFLVTARRPV